MATMDDKENLAPQKSSDPLQNKASLLSPRRSGRSKGRSKSIGPGSLDEPEPPKISAKDRRKSAFVPATKSILSKDEESAKAARRKSMMNRRVSFAPEATLHTWDIVEYAKDHTTSTDDTESTRRASAFSRSSASPGPSSDASQEDEDAELLSSPESRPGVKNTRRSSGIPPMNFNNPDDTNSSSGVSGSEDESGSDDEEEGPGDDTGTAMSLNIEDATMQSAAGSDDSTGSSARLEASLKAAAQMAGTRGIEYDEFGEMSMELVSEEVTNAFKPWAQRQPNDVGSASMDQENINPFSPAFKAEVQAQEDPIPEEDEGDMSMDVTRAIGGIVKGRPTAPASSPVSEGDGTMELTQAIGKIHGQKRRPSTTEAGSPGSKPPAKQPKRRRSPVARSSMGDETMDLTMAVGGIKSTGTGSPTKPDRRRSMRNRRSSGAVSEQDDATMDFTQAIGSIKVPNASKATGDESFDGNEDLSMELTTVLGGIRAGKQPVQKQASRAVTPRQSQSPVRDAANTTPKDQERFRDTPDMGAKKLLTPILEKQAEQSTGKRPSSIRSRKSLSPAKETSGSQRQTSASPIESANQTEESQNTAAISRLSPTKDNVSYPQLPAIDERPSPVRTPSSSPRRQTRKTPDDQQRERPTVLLQAPDQSPIAAKKERSSPARASTVTPEKANVSEDPRELSNSIRLMTTPRKEALKSVTPKKAAPAKQASPVKPMTPRGRPTPKNKEPAREPPSPVRRLNDDIEKIKASGQEVEKVGLQDFLTKAGIRFMDLTTTKRRLTTVATPSKSRDIAQDDEEINLETGVVAAACTVPELELYQHACHELKRYTKEGKQMIAQLEAATLREQPPLLRAYMHASPERKLALDAQMREMKTDARYRSKELWYAWRSQLLDELMGGLQTIGEGLIKDDEVLARAEEILEQALPSLVERQRSLQVEAERLEESVNAVSEEEKEELNATREKLGDVNSELVEKRHLVESLRKQVEEQDDAAEHLRESKDEFTAAIQEANRVREACRGVSLSEITALKESVKHLEETYGWSITSASSSPSTLTMSYKSELQLFFHPRAFHRPGDSDERANAPIRLTYIGEGKKPMTTTLRFFLQFLRASLLGLRQCATKISSLLGLVSNGWATASSVAEAERRVHLETLTDSRIVSDEQLAIEANVLLPKVRTKVRATFDVSASLVEDGDDLRMECHCDPKVVVVYGEQYNERNMGEYLRGLVDGGFEGWDDAVRGMREKLIARGAKGARK